MNKNLKNITLRQGCTRIIYLFKPFKLIFQICATQTLCYCFMEKLQDVLYKDQWQLFADVLQNAVDIRYHEYPLSRYPLSLCRTVSLAHSAFSLISLINPFGISNSAISNFHYVEQFSRTLQLFLGCGLPSTISNIRMRFSNESYCSFQAFEC